MRNTIGQILFVGLLFFACNKSEIEPEPQIVIDNSNIEIPDFEAPNIIIFQMDDAGYGDFGFTGNPVIQTPNINAFVEESVQMTNFYQGSSICSPSRASLLSGQIAGRVNIYGTVKFNREMIMNENVETIADIAKAQGYQTYQNGKLHVTNNSSLSSPQDYGFDYNNIDTWFDYSDAFSVSSTAIDFLNNRDTSKSFLMYLNTNEPHAPLDEGLVKPEFADMYEGVDPYLVERHGFARPSAVEEKAKFHFGSITQVDHAFGELVAYLKANDLFENTFILLTSDNGTDRISPESWGTTHPFTGAKMSVYDGGIHVIGVVSWPAVFRPGIVQEPMVGYDVLPTVKTLTKYDGNITTDGEDMLPILLGASRGKDIYIENFRGQTRPPTWPGRTEGVQAILIRNGIKVLAGYDCMKETQSVMNYIKTNNFNYYQVFQIFDDHQELEDLYDGSNYPSHVASINAFHREIQSTMVEYEIEYFRPNIQNRCP